MTVSRSEIRSLFRRCRRGTVAIEFGIITPVLVVLFVGVGEVGYAAYQAMQVQYAVEAGALYAAKHGNDPGGITGAVSNATSIAAIAATPAPASFCGCPGTAGIAAVSCTSNCANGNPPGQYVRISATLTRQSIIPNSGLPLPAAFTAQSIIRLY